MDFLILLLTKVEVTSAGAAARFLVGFFTSRGRLHPNTLALRRIYQIWAEMGFQIYRSRDVDIGFKDSVLIPFPLIQLVRPGCRVILPGMCYRNEQIAARSEIGVPLAGGHFSTLRMGCSSLFTLSPTLIWLNQHFFEHLIISVSQCERY